VIQLNTQSNACKVSHQEMAQNGQLIFRRNFWKFFEGN